MKCAACGYDEAIHFRKLKPILDENTMGDQHAVLACPKCGTIRLEKPVAEDVHKNRFHDCKCPWCGNTHPDEFEILSTQDNTGKICNWHKSVICSCGACGPHEDTAEIAIERFKAWGKK